MKKYRVNVNGTNYEVAIEVLDENAASEMAAVPTAPVTSTPTTPAASESSGSITISSPMPGNILSVNVKVGDVVKKGQVLLVLEAMKMENEIMAPSDGTVSRVNVATGATVDSGALLCSLN